MTNQQANTVNADCCQDCPFEKCPQFFVCIKHWGNDGDVSTCGEGEIA
jgi:hypothetical protein